MAGWFRRKETPPTVGASFVQEVAEVEQGVSRCQELQESLQERTNTQSLVLFQTLTKYSDMPLFFWLRQKWLNLFFLKQQPK